jgi:hypothetical protein
VDEARRLFLDLRESLRSKDDADSRYVRRYAQSFLALIRGDPFQMAFEQRQAARIECRSVLKRMLWMPREEPKDPFEAEFEAWMRVNYPEEESA